MFKFGVDSLIWTEEFTEKDLPLIEKAKRLGFEVIDINVSHPERFPVKAVKKQNQGSRHRSGHHHLYLYFYSI